VTADRPIEDDRPELLALCAGYFASYVVTGVLVKYFLGSAAAGYPGMADLAFLVYSTAGGSALCLAIVVGFRWWRFEPSATIAIGPLRLPAELPWIVASGVCTAVVIPTTTLLYTLPIPVMVAMVIMRGSVIAISRGVDVVLGWQGLTRKPVRWEENAAVAFALAAVSVHLVGAKDGFSFAGSPLAVGILGSYLAAYALRIYLMNWFKLTRPPGSPANNKAFFAIEQLAASGVLGLVVLGILLIPTAIPQIAVMRGAMVSPHPSALAAIGAGTVYGVVALFSVFLFMFRGRSATFAGLVNRLTSLVAGTAASVVSWWAFGARAPSALDVGSLALVLVAVGFLARADRRKGVPTPPSVPEGTPRVAA
jgi:hypothetical protein